MKENNEKLVIEGNAFYEIDMECVREKEQKKRLYSGEGLPAWKFQNLEIIFYGICVVKKKQHRRA